MSSVENPGITEIRGFSILIEKAHPGNPIHMAIRHLNDPISLIDWRYNRRWEISTPEFTGPRDPERFLQWLNQENYQIENVSLDHFEPTAAKEEAFNSPQDKSVARKCLENGIYTARMSYNRLGDRHFIPVYQNPDGTIDRQFFFCRDRNQETQIAIGPQCFLDPETFVEGVVAELTRENRRLLDVQCSLAQFASVNAVINYARLNNYRFQFCRPEESSFIYECREDEIFYCDGFQEEHRESLDEFNERNSQNWDLDHYHNITVKFIPVSQPQSFISRIAGFVKGLF